QRQRGAARHPARARGRVFQLSHQTHQGQPVHGGARRGSRIRASKPRQARKDGAAMKAGILNASVLIVDDQPSNVALLEETLREAGYTGISSTMDPLEVCALHRKNRYDLILLDLQMPGMDGFQVMEGLKTNIADDYLPVIVLT